MKERINKHLVVAGMVVAFSLIMLLAAVVGEARASSGTACTPPLPLPVHDAELCRTPHDSVESQYEGVSEHASVPSAFPLGWFITGVVVGLAVLIAFALEAPAARPYVPFPTQGVRL